MTKKLLLVAAALFGLVNPLAQAGTLEQFDALFHQAQFESRQKHCDRAVELANQARALSGRESGVPTENRVRNLVLLASCHRDMNRLVQAEDGYLDALSLLQSSSLQPAPMQVFAMVSLADVYVLDQKPARAEVVALQAVSLSEQPGAAEVELIGPLGALGSAYLAQGKLDLAKATLERGVRIADAAKFQGGSYFQNLYLHTAKLYRLTGREADALAFEKRAAAVTTVIMNATNVRPPGTAILPSVIPNSCRPEYPEEAVLYELIGEARVKFSVDVTGQPQNLAITRSSGWSLLDKATLEGFARCRYKPATRDGKPVQVELAYAYRWTLDGDTPPELPKLIKESCLPSKKFAVAPEATTQATLLLRFLLDPEGKPYRTVVESSSLNPVSDRQAIQFIEACRYQPTIFEGKAVSSAANIRLLVN